MTTAQNNVDRIDRNYTSRRVVITTNLTVNAGDLVYWDPINYTLTPLTATSQVANQFFGVAMQSNANLIYPNDNDQVGLIVLVRGVVWLNSTAPQTYGPFTSVTVGADSQTVTDQGVTTANTIGWTWSDPPNTPRASASTPVPEIVGGLTQTRIPIQLNPAHVVAAAI